MFLSQLVGGFQYRNDTPLGEALQFFPTAEGYVSVVDGEKFNYVFNYTDHLGNIRVSYTYDQNDQQLKILEENHYYPFGLKHSNYNTDKARYKTDQSGIHVVIAPTERSEYQYKYNGKEFQDELGLNMYDYGARNYDAALGRWMNIDPLAEKHPHNNPFMYANNNPIIFIDPDGMQADTFKVDDNGNIEKVDSEKHYDDNEVEVDLLIKGDKELNKDGEIKNKSVKVEKGVLENKVNSSAVVERKPIEGYTLNFGSNKINAKEVFEFMAANTTVEFSLYTAGDPSVLGNSTSFLSTSKERGVEVFGSTKALDYARRGYLIEHSHNHPDRGETSQNDFNFQAKILETVDLFEDRNPGRQFHMPKLTIYRGKNYDKY